MADVLKSVAALSAARVVTAAMQFAILPIITRHLSPEEFGLVAIAMVVVTLAGVLSDAGMGRSLMREGTADALVWSSGFWLFAALGLALSACVLASAPLLAYIFDAPALVPLISVLAMTPLLQSLSAVFFADLEKRQAFLVLAVIILVPAVLSSIAAVVLAIGGAGSWALVVQQIVLFGLQFILLLVFSRFRPERRFSFAALRGHLRFGRDTLGWTLVQFIHRQSLVFVVGKVGTMAQLGTLAMATRFTRLPALTIGQPLSRVIYVRMAATHATPGAVGQLFSFGTWLLAVVIFPPMLLVAASGETFFALILGEGWGFVAPIFALLAPGIALQTTLSLNGSAFMASGRTELRLRAMTEMTAVWLIAMAVAIPFGVLAIAGARTLSMIVFLPRLAMFTARGFGSGLREICDGLAGPVLVSMCAAVAHVVMTRVLALGTGAELSLAALLLVAAWVALAGFGRHRLRDGLALLQNPDAQSLKVSP